MILLTGAYGFVGAHVLRCLSARGIHLLPMSRQQRDGAVMADLISPESFEAIPWPRITGVVHCASTIPARNAQDASYGANVLGTQNLLDALSGSPRLRAFVLVSSASVYRVSAERDEVTLCEANMDFEPDGYGASKRRQEEAVVSTLGQRVPVTVFRPSSIYGAGMAQSTVLPTLWRRAVQGEPLTITAPATYYQNFVAVGDVASLLADAIEGESPGCFNLFSDETMDMMELARRIVRLTGNRSAIIDSRSDASWPVVTFDNARLKARFPERVFKSLEQGLKEMESG